MTIKGIVLEGKKKGREIGFPTANITNTAKIPAGIFAAKVLLCDRKLPGAAYVGALSPDVVEVHLIGFDGDLYGKEISITILQKVRDDIRETDAKKLHEIIANDIEKIKNLVYSRDATRNK